VVASIPSPPSSKNAQARVALEVGAVVAERFRIVGVIGEGRSGTVYAAEHVVLQKKVALKILHPELTDTPDGVARFEREAMATARIEHPNVAAAIDFGKLPEGSRYLATELVQGRSLRETIAKGPLELGRALHVARQIASALAAAQALEIVHRDLSPENVILVTRDDDPDFVKIIDFGTARIAVEQGDVGGPQGLTKAGAVFGSPEYIPPEQGIGQKVDSRADLYALGVMMFEMLAGVRPYVERDDVGILAQQLTLPVPTFAERAPGITVPPPVERMIYRLLAQRPQERTQRAEELVKAIEQFLAGGPAMSGAPPAPLDPLPAFALNTQLQIPVAAPPTSNREAQPSTDVERSGALPQGEPLVVKTKPRNQALQSIVRSLRHSFASSVEFVSKRRETLPEPLRGWLIRVPAAAIEIAGIVLLLLSFTLLGLWLHRPSAKHMAADGAASAASTASKAAEPSVSPSAGAAPSDMAGVQRPSSGSDANDPISLIEWAQAKLHEGHDAEAVSTLVRMLVKHPDRRNDDRVADILFKTASSNANGVSNTTFSLLQGTMAGQGAEVIYQLAIDRSVSSHVRARAEKWLHTVQFDRAASDALRVATRLRLASSCETRHAMLPIAAKAGGTAALTYLRELQVETGCGLTGTSDCFACMRKDSLLKDAIAQIEERQRRKDN